MVSPEVAVHILWKNGAFLYGNVFPSCVVSDIGVMLSNIKHPQNFQTLKEDFMRIVDKRNNSVYLPPESQQLKVVVHCLCIIER